MARQIAKELDMPYLGYDKLNMFGANYIDAADFLFLAQNEKRLRVHVNGRDCAECESDIKLKDLIRARITAALSKTLPAWIALLATTAACSAGT